MLDKKAPAEVKTYALGKGLSRLDYLDNYLKGREFLLDHFSVADAYLVTVINWTMATPPIDLAKWPEVKAYYERTPRAAEHRQGAGRGVRAVQGGTGAAQGGGVRLGCGLTRRRPCESRDPYSAAVASQAQSSNTLLKSSRSRVWVPAFAGTTVR